MGKPNPLGGNWCKHCNVFVKDTPLEKKHHETSFKHQNNIQKTLRSLHKNKEREDRQKEQAKAEVARLNKTVGGSRAAEPSAVPKGISTKANAPPPPKPSSAAAAIEDRRRQMEQLVAMGVAVPDHHRQDMAMPGEWRTVSETVLRPVKLADEEAEAEDGPKLVPSGASGSRKRKVEQDSDSDDPSVSRKKWGTALKTYPGDCGRDATDEDLEALLSSSVTVAPKSESLIKQENQDAETGAAPSVAIKRSESDEDVADKANLAGTVADDTSSTAGPTVVFKKRKPQRR